MSFIFDVAHLPYILALTVAGIMSLGPLFGWMGDVDHDHDQDLALHATPADGWFRSLTVRLLVVLGVGRAPLGVLVVGALLGFGVTGMSLTTVAEQAGWVSKWVYVPVTLAVSTFAGLLSCAINSKFAQWWLPRTETTLVTVDSLVGSVAKVVVPGVAQVRDAHGNLHQIRYRLKGCGEEYQPGQEILLVDFDPVVRMFFNVTGFDTNSVLRHAEDSTRGRALEP